MTARPCTTHGVMMRKTMPPTNVPARIPNWAHPWMSDEPVKLSIVPQIGAVIPPSAIDQKVTARVKVRIPTGRATMQ